MPNPLTKVRGHPPLDISPTPLGVARKPELARRVAAIIGQWAHVESSLGQLLANLLGSQGRVGVALYNGLSGATARKAVLKAAASATLSADDFDLFAAIMLLHRPLATTRNAIVHDIWVDSDAVPDALLLMPADVWIEYRAWIAQSINHRESFKPFPHNLWDKVQVYTPGELDDVYQRSVALVRYLANFQMLRDVSNQQRDQARHALDSATPIQEALRRIRAQSRKQVPSSPLKPPDPPSE